MWSPWLLGRLARGELRLYTDRAYKRFFAGVSTHLYKVAGIPLATDDELLASTTEAMGGLACPCSEAPRGLVVLAWCRSTPSGVQPVLAWRRLRGLRRAEILPARRDSYLVVVDGVGASIIVVTGEGAREEPPLQGREEEAYKLLWEAYREYGPYKLRDAQLIVANGLGVGRAEARLLVESIIAKNLVIRGPGGLLRLKVPPP